MEAMIMNEPMQLAFEPQSYKQQTPRKRPRRTASIDIIRDHLVTEKTISPQQAMELYGITVGSLTAAISRLRNEEKWRISTIPPEKRGGDERASYRLEDPLPAQEEAVSEDLAEADLKSETTCRFADAVSVTLGEDGMDIQVVCEGKHIRFRPAQLQYLTMSIAYRADAARKA